ncbi:hypothetical protein CRUP_021230 [Coryphaenoides rupestris]|nr:hypothetical protein CRUP_021230 [Coryphaenoides rupestris]
MDTWDTMSSTATQRTHGHLGHHVQHCNTEDSWTPGTPCPALQHRGVMDTWDTMSSTATQRTHGHLGHHVQHCNTDDSWTPRTPCPALQHRGLMDTWDTMSSTATQRSHGHLGHHVQHCNTEESWASAVDSTCRAVCMGPPFLSAWRRGCTYTQPATKVPCRVCVEQQQSEAHVAVGRDDSLLAGRSEQLRLSRLDASVLVNRSRRPSFSTARGTSCRRFTSSPWSPGGGGHCANYKMYGPAHLVTWSSTPGHLAQHTWSSTPGHLAQHTWSPGPAHLVQHTWSPGPAHLVTWSSTPGPAHLVTWPSTPGSPPANQRAGGRRDVTEPAANQRAGSGATREQRDAPTHALRVNIAVKHEPTVAKQKGRNAAAAGADQSGPGDVGDVTEPPANQRACVNTAFPVVVTRSNNVYGPRQHREKGTAPKSRHFLYVDDVIEAFLLVLEKGAVGGVYNVGDGHEVPIVQLARELVKMVQNVPDTQLNDWLELVPDRPRVEMRYPISSEKLRQLGWRPRTLPNPTRSMNANSSAHRGGLQAVMSPELRPQRQSAGGDVTRAPPRGGLQAVMSPELRPQRRSAGGDVTRAPPKEAFPVVVTRSNNVYGPRQHREKVPTGTFLYVGMMSSRPSLLVLEKGAVGGGVQLMRRTGHEARVEMRYPHQTVRSSVSWAEARVPWSEGLRRTGKNTGHR